MYDLYNKETNIFIPKEETIMNSTATQIAKIISTPNPSAPITTHALAELGNGSMQNGLRRIISYFAAESASKLRLGRIQGSRRNCFHIPRNTEKAIRNRGQEYP